MCSARCETCILFRGLWFAKNSTGFGHLSGLGKIDLHVRSRYIPSTKNANPESLGIPIRMELLPSEIRIHPFRKYRLFYEQTLDHISKLLGTAMGR